MWYYLEFTLSEEAISSHIVCVAAVLAVSGSILEVVTSVRLTLYNVTLRLRDVHRISKVTEGKNPAWYCVKV